ncbi:hypothetical protein ACQJ0Y_27400, partial [Peribacillus simplex]|uniref:hypothetical protein n=1 Tax=Peribacillus simplex TaxID=1478 RepID=UPI003CF12DC0
QGDYVLRVTSSELNASLYPAGPISLDSVPFLVVTGSLNEGPPALAALIPNNARCRMNENFARYASPPGPPERRDPEDLNGIGFCSTVSDRG